MPIDRINVFLMPSACLQIMGLNFVFLLLVVDQQVVHRQGNLRGQVVETLLKLQLLDPLNV